MAYVLWVKSDEQANMFRKPFTEYIDAQLCERVIEPDDFVPFGLEANARLKNILSVTDWHKQWVYQSI